MIAQIPFGVHFHSTLCSCALLVDKAIDSEMSFFFPKNDFLGKFKINIIPHHKIWGRSE